MIGCKSKLSTLLLDLLLRKSSRTIKDVDKKVRLILEISNYEAVHLRRPRTVGRGWDVQFFRGKKMQPFKN